MARRKQEIALQTEIESLEEWEEMLAKEGITGKNNGKKCWLKRELQVNIMGRNAGKEGITGKYNGKKCWKKMELQVLLLLLVLLYIAYIALYVYSEVLFSTTRLSQVNYTIPVTLVSLILALGHARLLGNSRRAVLN